MANDRKSQQFCCKFNECYTEENWLSGTYLLCLVPAKLDVLLSFLLVVAAALRPDSSAVLRVPGEGI